MNKQKNNRSHIRVVLFIFLILFYLSCKKSKPAVASPATINNKDLSSSAGNPALLVNKIIRTLPYEDEKLPVPTSYNPKRGNLKKNILLGLLISMSCYTITRNVTSPWKGVAECCPQTDNYCWK